MVDKSAEEMIAELKELENESWPTLEFQQDFRKQVLVLVCETTTDRGNESIM
jgi:hypothetical protein